MVVDALFRPGSSRRIGVWMILDAARDKRIFGAVDGSYSEKCCLYSGVLPWQLKMAAPYLVQLEREDRFTEFAIDHGWGQAWGIFLRSEAQMTTLRRHLRGFLRVRDTAGRRLIFRYYDPRVLRAYLPTCRPDELRTIYGPVDEFLCEAADGGTLLEYRIDGLQLSETRVPVESGL
jgi:hypothetical protein